MKLETDGISGANAVGNILNINGENAVRGRRGSAVRNSAILWTVRVGPGEDALARAAMQGKVTAHVYTF